MTDPEDMLPMLFVGTECPNCRALESQLDLPEHDPGLHEGDGFHVAVINTGAETAVTVPEDEESVDAMSYADFHNITRVPALVDDGGDVVIDPFEIRERLSDEQ